MFNDHLTKNTVLILGFGLFALLNFSSCTKKNEPRANTSTVSDPQAAAKSRGRSIYMSQCIACHNADPKVDGALGPSVAGSSRELLEARIVHAKYPEGYTPKRSTKTMVALPHLKDEIDSIYTFLNAL